MVAVRILNAGDVLSAGIVATNSETGKVDHRVDSETMQTFEFIVRRFRVTDEEKITRNTSDNFPMSIALQFTKLSLSRSSPFSLGCLKRCGYSPKCKIDSFTLWQNIVITDRPYTN